MHCCLKCERSDQCHGWHWTWIVVWIWFIHSFEVRSFIADNPVDWIIQTNKETLNLRMTEDFLWIFERLTNLSKNSSYFIIIDVSKLFCSGGSIFMISTKYFGSSEYISLMSLIWIPKWTCFEVKALVKTLLRWDFIFRK